MKKLFKTAKSGLVNLYKNDYEMFMNTTKSIFRLRTDNLTLQTEPRTEDGYFIYKFGEIYDKYVLGKTSYRHI